MELKKKTRSKFLVTVRCDEFDGDMMSWLEGMLGTAGRRGTWRYGWGHWAKSHGDVHNFWFKDELNATMFILRWSGNV